MKRREFVGLVEEQRRPSRLWREQQAILPVVGFLNSASAEGYASMAASFKGGLKEAGYAKGRT